MFISHGRTLQQQQKVLEKQNNSHDDLNGCERHIYLSATEILNAK